MSLKHYNGASLKEQGFSMKRAGCEDIKRILAIYCAQNIMIEKFKDFDGERGDFRMSKNREKETVSNFV